MDTNALMMPVERGVRVFEELDRLLGRGGADLVVPEAVVAELRKLADGASEEAVAASVGLDLALERCRIVETDEPYADDAVVELAEGGCDYVVTNDKPLRDRLLERDVRVIGIRGQNKLEVTKP
ncbi:MAG: PIN domain-containing protein [Haloferacaceae archaeon]